MTVDHRQEALARIKELTELLRSGGGPNTAAIVAECDALSRAVAAFHMEGIRFRMYNVDRLLRGGVSEATARSHPAAAATLEDVRRHLEAAGFHTRSHQAPG